MKADKRSRRPMAFSFVLEELDAADPVVKPMFGCHAIYVKEKIVLILRNKKNADNNNGVWIATTPEHHESLRKVFPSMRTISVFGSPESGWQNLAADHDRFEEDVMKVCELIIQGDPRIGKIPKPRKKTPTNSKR